MKISVLPLCLSVNIKPTSQHSKHKGHPVPIFPSSFFTWITSLIKCLLFSSSSLLFFLLSKSFFILHIFQMLFIFHFYCLVLNCHRAQSYISKVQGWISCDWWSIKDITQHTSMDLPFPSIVFTAFYSFNHEYITYPHFCCSQNRRQHHPFNLIFWLMSLY